jgi:hypothetical protein
MRIPYVSFTHLLYAAFGYAVCHVVTRLRRRHTYTVVRYLTSSLDNVVVGTARSLQSCTNLVDKFRQEQPALYSDHAFAAHREDGKCYEATGELPQDLRTPGDMWTEA